MNTMVLVKQLFRISFMHPRVSFRILVKGGQNEILWIPGGAKYYPPGSKAYGYLGNL